MTVVRLSSVATIESGNGFPLAHQGKVGEDFPFLKVSDMNISGNERYITRWNHSIDEVTRILIGAKLFPPETIIFPKIGAAIATNKKRQLTIPSCIDNNIMGVTPDADVLLPDYLYYLFLNKNLSDFASSANPPSIRKSDVENWEINIPSLSDQLKTVSILSKAQQILTLRQKVFEKSQELTSAIFYKFFGDISSNSMDWPLMKVSEFVDRFEGGKNILAGSEGGSPFRILKVSAVTSGEYEEDESKPSPDNYEPPQKHIVKVGDLLFSRANTLHLVGATALVRKTNGYTLLPDKLWRFIWKIPMEPIYVNALFQTESIRNELGRLSSGTSASMRNISQEKLFNMTLPIAPHEIQLKFARVMKQVSLIKDKNKAVLDKSEEFYQSVLNKLLG